MPRGGAKNRNIAASKNNAVLLPLEPISALSKPPFRLSQLYHTTEKCENSREVKLYFPKTTPNFHTKLFLWYNIRLSLQAFFFVYAPQYLRCEKVILYLISFFLQVTMQQRWKRKKPLRWEFDSLLSTAFE